MRFLLDFSLIGLERFEPSFSFSFSRALGLSAALRMNCKATNGLPTPDGRVTEGERGDVLEKVAFRPVELGVRGVEGTDSKLSWAFCGDRDCLGDSRKGTARCKGVVRLCSMCIAGFESVNLSFGSDDRAEWDGNEAEVIGTGELTLKREMADEQERCRLGAAVVG